MLIELIFFVMGLFAVVGGCGAVKHKRITMEYGNVVTGKMAIVTGYICIGFGLLLLTSIIASILNVI